MMLLNISKLDSSVRYLNQNLSIAKFESLKSKFEVISHLQWKFELYKSVFYDFLVFCCSERKLFTVHVRHSYTHLSFLISCISVSFSLQHFLCNG